MQVFIPVHLSWAHGVCLQGPSEGSPEPGKYAEELTENVRPNETPEGPQDVPPAVPSASKGAI